MTCPYCGGDKPRSLPQHRRFFGMLRSVFEQWPEAHGFRPESAEELRAWLLVKAGYRRVSYLDIGMMPSHMVLPVVTGALRAAGAYAWLAEHQGRIAVLSPRSIRFEALGHKAFCSLERAVEDVIHTETGLDPEQVLQERSRAA
jgi:hypothetical protein